MPLIDDVQRQQWIDAILQGNVCSIEFARSLEKKPATIRTNDDAEYFEIFQRERAGTLRIGRMEGGASGYTFSVYYPQPEQKNLL